MISQSILEKACTISGPRDSMPRDLNPGVNKPMYQGERELAEEEEEEVVPVVKPRPTRPPPPPAPLPVERPPSPKRVVPVKPPPPPKRVAPVRPPPPAPRKAPPKQLIPSDDEEEDAPALCPCIVAKTKKPCGNKAKYNGRCGLHKNKCILPVDEEEEEEEKEKLCPCIVTTKDKIKKPCGNKAKYNGRCGLHKNKCILPVDEEEEEEEEEKKPAPAVPKVVPQKRIVAAEIEEVKEEGLCQCIIMPRKAGDKPKVCGRKIKENGRCGIHQRTCNTLDTIPAAPVQEGDVVKCNYISKKSGEVCGKPVLKGTDKCSRHQKTGTQTAIVRGASPLIEAKAPEAPRELEQELKDFADDLEDAFEDPEEVQEPVEQQPELAKEWVTVGADYDSISQYIQELDQQPAFNVLELASVEEKIQACLSL